jgi:hypothetical protein
MAKTKAEELWDILGKAGDITKKYMEGFDLTSSESDLVDTTIDNLKFEIWKKLKRKM